MEYFRHLSLCFFLYLAVVGRYVLASEWRNWNWPTGTWHGTLPNTQMPKSLLKILQSGGYTQIQGKNINEAIGKNAIAHPQATNFKNDAIFDYNGRVSPQNINIGYGRDHEDVFFLEDDLRPAGQKLKLRFPESERKAKFLPRKVADTIPFSSKKLPEILNRFAIKSGSVQADVVKETIKQCEEQAMQGENKFCATSPESLIDFSISVLGKKVQVFTTEVDDGVKKMSNKLQEYSIENIEQGVQKIGDSALVCHKKNYVYAVFYCHEISATRAYTVSLVGADGTRVKAVALCHQDTRFWNPQHVAFQMLKVKPGTVPICHFLERGNLVWVRN